MDVSDKYMGTKDAAELWGTSQAYVKNLCIAGKIKSAAKVGRNWLIARSEPNPKQKKGE